MRKLKLFIMLFLSLFLCLSFNYITSVSANSLYSSDILNELSYDSNFDLDDFPKLTYEELVELNEPLLKIIQIAETNDNNLYIYVYQPVYEYIDVQAKKISMSTEYSINGIIEKPTLKNLKLISNYDVFYKYQIEDFKILDSNERYYNFVSIYRNLNETIDENIENGVTDYKAIEVGQQWCCSTINDNVVYEMNTFGTLSLTPIMNGTLRLENGFTWNSFWGKQEDCSLHFLAFRCDEYVIKHIFNAVISYSTKTHKLTRTGDALLGYNDEHEYYNEQEHLNIPLSDKDVFTFEGSGIGGKTISWNRILSKVEFIESFVNNGGEWLKGEPGQLNNAQWVFSFAEFDYVYDQTQTMYGKGPLYVTETLVTDVTILTLHFQDINDDIYNLGVVMDMTSPDDKFDGEFGIDLSFLNELFEKIFLLIGLLVLVFLLSTSIPLIKLLFNGIVYLFKILLNLILLPFKLIGNIFKKKKRK